MRTSVRTIILTAALLLGPVAAAEAGTYTVYGCRAPDGSAALTSSWIRPAPSETAVWGDSCPAGLSMTIPDSQAQADGTSAVETFYAAAPTTIRNYTLAIAVRLPLNGGYYDQIREYTNGMWTVVAGCSEAGACHDHGDFGDPTAASNLFSHWTKTDTTAVQIRLVCGLPKGCPRQPARIRPAEVVLFQSAITLWDNWAPQFVPGYPQGNLLDPNQVFSGSGSSGGPSAPTVTISALDVGSGVYQAIAVVRDHNGQIVDTQTQTLNSKDPHCAPPFEVPVPCPQSASGVFALDTTQLADGSHTLQLGVSDAAGNVAWSGSFQIVTDNSPCDTTPAAAGFNLHAAFAVPTPQRRRVGGRTRTVWRTTYATNLRTSFLRPPSAVGALTDASGAPVAGVPVCVAVQDDLPNAPLTPVASIITGADGTFSHRLAPGPSRTVYFIYRIPSGAIFDSIHITVKVPVRVHVNRFHLLNGQIMTWSGHLPGPIPPGLLALMEVYRGTYWQPFETIHVNQNGQWIGRYRFQFTTGLQTYTFRLLVPQQAGFPYAHGHSPAFNVSVSG